MGRILKTLAARMLGGHSHRAAENPVNSLSLLSIYILIDLRVISETACLTAMLVLFGANRRRLQVLELVGMLVTFLCLSRHAQSMLYAFN